MYYKIQKDSSQQAYLEVDLSGFNLINTPLLNKGSAFTLAERSAFNLHGLLPAAVDHIETQLIRSYRAFQIRPTPIQKYLYLRDLQDSNETLFYALLNQHIVEMLPIVYTPTVGLACQQFSHIYRRPRGIFISGDNLNRIDQILANPRFDQTEIIVVSDGERILGLGDQGAGGMGIPIGKSALYTLCAGISPGATLPVLLDTGTNNQQLLEDPLYLGWRHPRLRGQAYADLVETFITAIKKRFPQTLLHWEDFAQQNAYSLLQQYQPQLCCFNDDIQGTASVATGALLAAVQVTGTPLREQRIIVMGAGSAGCGISQLIMHAMMQEGLSKEEARQHFYLIDKDGLLLEGATTQPFQQDFIKPRSAILGWKLADAHRVTLADTVKNLKPTLLLGVCSQAGIFSEAIVREMASHVQQPIIFPLSNPTELAEATPDDLIRWTAGKAIISTGSPFADVNKNGKIMRVDQTNNCYIFPGLGLAVVATKASTITDSMFLAAAKALASTSPALKQKNANLLPPLTEIKSVSLQVAIATAKEVIRLGLHTNPIDENKIEEYIEEMMWHPHYLPYRKK